MPAALVSVKKAGPFNLLRNHNWPHFTRGIFFVVSQFADTFLADSVEVVRDVNLFLKRVPIAAASFDNLI